MFGILLSAVNAALGFVFRGVILKFVVMFAAWWIAVELVAAVVSLVPSTGSIAAAMGQFPPMLWFLLDLMRVDVGIPLVLAAMGTRFLIRRIPFIG